MLFLLFSRLGSGVVWIFCASLFIFFTTKLKIFNDDWTDMTDIMIKKMDFD